MLRRILASSRYLIIIWETLLLGMGARVFSGWALSPD